ncbi:sulfur carrier protein ThiS [Shewanella sp. SR43-4]|jgi:sulfur carrier protein|uniref:Sulfur carrier protein ThiS n=1 Tax=Shewanella vesiculosa TaxID=518738 RepID=A0ABV0FQZ3_9GAMM|nr:MULTISPECIES: sulfur carrier protein ThiS [Shewanella]NCQ45932.1 sulfur carrier protein ThiS [Shewanella frigidimarina]MBB1319048.1 sulfur carrier protein ThiS [Shewanella sp. SR43-4]MBB1323436.1 sulfur carrier protein ThiS [Shewanella sp. SR43-8]MBB1388545.1 sulfur carrier protein ThiS [Shewanella sp. SG44-6]MBB1476190.1 sulfur carrier protein ThiS [Shewanella sp. SG41-3]
MTHINCHSQIALQLNGVEQIVRANLNLAELLILSDLPTQAVAIVVNDSVVPRSRWVHVLCQANDNITVFSAVAGG